MRALITVCLFVPAACFADQWNKHFDASGSPELHIFSGNAALEVRSGSGSGVDVELKTEGISIGQSQAHIESHQNGNRLDLRVEMPKLHFDWGNHSVRVEVRLSRDVTAFLESENGPVELRDLHGAVHIRAGNGPIGIEGFDGSVEAQTGNGPLTVDGRFDGLELRTGNGPLDLTVNAGSKLASKWYFETGNGPVSIKLPQHVSADLSIHTGNGPFSFDLPVERHVIDRHNFEAKLNGGGPELSIHTGHGPVTIGRS